MNVTALKVTDWNKDGTVVKVSNITFDDGREVPGYDLPPGVEVGKPLPDGWEIATAKSGKPYIKVPKAGKGGGFGGGPAAFRNTKEGQAYEQERMDRRTALMQAVALFDVSSRAGILRDLGATEVANDIEDCAESLYEFLRSSITLPVSSAETGAGVSPTPAPTTSPVSPRSTVEKSGVGEGVRATGNEEWGAKPEAGEGTGKAPCSHQSNSDRKPNGELLPRGFIRCESCGFTRRGAV